MECSGTVGRLLLHGRRKKMMMNDLQYKSNFITLLLSLVDVAPQLLVAVASQGQRNSARLRPPGTAVPVPVRLLLLRGNPVGGGENL